jgi:hypothetical protein
VWLKKDGNQNFKNGCEEAFRVFKNTGDKAVSQSILKALFVFLVIVVAGCRPVPSADLVLFDFERDDELNMLHWSCGTLYSLSAEFATLGAQSLKIELYPSAYPGFRPKLEVTDWRGYTALAMEIHNPSSESVVLTLRVDDEKKSSYGERYNGRVVIKPGTTAFFLPFDALVTSGSHRPLNLKQIQQCLLFTSSPGTRQVLYLDAVRLVAGRAKVDA